ncbi:MAG TPA: DUF2892 domain-containing protein [Leptolyngbyaceae cyanobacterium M65_K2018_010]|nr:DUF2892 domain-containing protein [Leptolyngbyaceae cyanobacterium M65_K2018_010]
MQANVGSLDRKIRFVAGAALVVLGLLFKSWFGLIGLVLLATAFMRWCPAYWPFKFSTCDSNTSLE